MDAYIPKHMTGAVKQYIEDGIPPGSFLTAVICNDLKEAVGRADHINIQALPNIVSWFYINAPRECWGSPEKFEAWIAAKKPQD